MSNVEFFEDLSEDIIEDMTHELKQEQFENNNVVFKEGDHCRGIMYIIDGEIELSYSKDNQSILVDRLGRGSYLFPYTSLTNEPVRQSNRYFLVGLEWHCKGKDECNRYTAVDYPR